MINNIIVQSANGDSSNHVYLNSLNRVLDIYIHNIISKILTKNTLADEII